MGERPINFVLSRLKNVRRSGDGNQASCPCHDDQSPSLSVLEGDDGRVLLKCFAGCTAEDIVRSIGLTMADLFVTSTKKNTVITISDLAVDKRIPELFLRSLGLTDRGDGVVITYRLENGSPAPRQRLRTALKAKTGSVWMFGKGKVVPYGLDRLTSARQAGFLVLVEGESDCWTLWFHGFPALGVPGADMTNTIAWEYVNGIGTIYVIRESDAAGASFVRRVGARLARLGWTGEIRVVTLGDTKDPNELHQRGSEEFKDRFNSALQSAALLPPPSHAPSESEIDGDQLDRAFESSGLSELRAGASHDEVISALRDFASQIAESSGVVKAVAREAAVRLLQTHGFKSPAKLVDAALGTQGADSKDSDGSSSMILDDPEPSSEPVDGVALLNAIAATFLRFLVLPPGSADALALWVLHTYLMEIAFISPIIGIVSPRRRCGKSTLLCVLASLVRRCLLTGNITAAALFRTIAQYCPALLIDEADTFLAKSDELRGVINAGHTRRTAAVIRTVGDNHEPQLFSTWCPKTIALIGRLPGTLDDRSIIIRMRRRTKTEKVARLRQDQIHDDLASLRAQAARWAADSQDALRDTDPNVPEQLNDRAQDNWRPLLAIADAVGGDWPQRARAAALALGGAEEVDESAQILLLSDLRDLFQERGVDRLFSEEIIKALVRMEHRPWPEWDHGKPLSTNHLAKLLKPFDVRPRSIRIENKTGKGYTLEDLNDTFLRYLPAEPSHRNNVEISPLSSESQPSQPTSCDGSSNAEEAQNGDVVTGVTAAKPDDTERTGAQPALPFTSIPPIEEWDL